MISSQMLLGILGVILFLTAKNIQVWEGYGNRVSSQAVSLFNLLVLIMFKKLLVN